MSRKGKFKPLMISRAERARFVDEFFARMNLHIEAWRRTELSGLALTEIYWLELMRLWRPKDYRSGAFFRSCPARAHRGFDLWKARPDIIHVTETIPPAAELLERQCNGQRVLTLMLTPASFMSEVNGRDPLSFMLHDLVHAYEFFADQEQMRAQIEFYRKLRLELAESASLRERLDGDADFAEKFEYLIADMNSHPAHLDAYYRHICAAHDLSS